MRSTFVCKERFEAKTNLQSAEGLIDRLQFNNHMTGEYELMDTTMATDLGIQRSLFRLLGLPGSNPQLTVYHRFCPT